LISQVAASIAHDGFAHYFQKSPAVVGEVVLVTHCVIIIHTFTFPVFSHYPLSQNMQSIFALAISPWTTFEEDSSVYYGASAKTG
jgi:hypothetical protein